jgi:uncharacterized protein YjaZ
MKIITSEKFTKEQSDFVGQIITDSVNCITPFISLSNIIFKVFLDEDKTIPEQGVCGYAPDDKKIELYLALSREKDWQIYFPRTIAHEWHHLARWRGPGYGETIAEAIISEGLA